MYKKFLILFLFLITTHISFSQLKSPEEFLGYKMGSRYTPHWKIVNYFNHVAANCPTTVKLEKYGETNEGRPLIMTFVSSAENMQHLDAIRRQEMWRYLSHLGYDMYHTEGGYGVEPGAALAEVDVMKWTHYDIMALPNRRASTRVAA